MKSRVCRENKRYFVHSRKSVKIFIGLFLCVLELGFSIFPLSGNPTTIRNQGNGIVKSIPARPATIPAPPIMNPDVLEVNTTDGIFGPYQAIYQYGDAEVGLFYSMSGNAVQNETRNVSGFNITLPEDYYSYWNLSYVNVFNATPVISQNKSQYFPMAPSANISYPLKVNLTGVAYDIKEIDLPIMNATNMSILFDYVNLTDGDTLRIYNDSGWAEDGQPVYEFAPGTWGLNSTPWLVNTTRAYLVLNSAGSGASYEISIVNYEGNINFYSGADKWNWTIIVDPDVCGFNLTLSQLDLPEGAKLFYSDPWGKNVTELWNFPGISTNYTYVQENFTAGRMWGPDRWVDPEYVVLALHCNDPNNYKNCNFTVAAIEYLVTKGWQRFFFPKDTVSLNIVDHLPLSQHVNVSFASFEGNASYYPSWSLLFKKIPKLNINLSFYDELNENWMSDPVVLHHDGNYTLRVNVTNATLDPIDWSNIQGAPTNLVTVHFAQGESFRYEGVAPLHNGIANFTLNNSAGFGLENLTGGEVIAVITVGGVNYGIFDNTSSRMTDYLYFFEQPTFTLNSISSEVFETTTSPEVTTTVGTNYDPNFVFFNVSATDIFNNPEPLNGQPVNVTIWKEHPITKEYQFVESLYVYQSYQPADGTSYLKFPYSFRDIGNWSVTFDLLNETIGKPQGYYDRTNNLTANVTVVVRDLGIDIFNSTEGLHPGQVSPVFVNVTDREEVGFPLAGWNVDLYFWRKMGAHWEDYYIGSTTTNNTGIAKLNWLPPSELAGQQIFLQAVARTPEAKLSWYEANETQVKKGFELLKLVTNVSLSTDRPNYVFDDDTLFSVNLNDELGRSLVGEIVQVNVTYWNTTHDQRRNTLYNLIIGSNSSGIITSPPSNFVGTIEFNMTYNGCDVLYETFSSVIRNVTKIPTRTIIDLETFGYNFVGDTTVPVHVRVETIREGKAFDDPAGSLYYEVYNLTGELVYWNQKSLASIIISQYEFTDWDPANSSTFQIRAGYTGGQFYEPSEINKTIFIDRADIDIALEIPQIYAGESLVLGAAATYHSDGKPVNGSLPILFTYTDLMGNTYVLGCVNTIWDQGTAELIFPYNSTNKVVYEYMVVFGGQLTATSLQNLQYRSGTCVVRDFQIAKCPTSISISLSRIEVSPGGRVTIEANLAGPGGISVTTGLLLVEVYSNTGVTTGQLDFVVPNLVYSYTVPRDGVYFVKIIYKGNLIYETSAEIATFTCGEWVLESDGDAYSTQITAQSILEGATPYLFYLGIGVFMLILAFFGIYKKKTSKLNQRRVKGLLAAMLFIVADIGGLVGLMNAMPNPYVDTTDPNAININPMSSFAWINDENLPEEYREQYNQQLQDAKMAKTLITAIPSLNDYQGIDPSDLAGLLALGQIGNLGDLFSPQTADGTTTEVYDLNLGFFSKLPYPIGDILNVTFATNVTANYYITITNLATLDLVETIFGSSPPDQSVEIMIPIDENHFTAGLDYALELHVYDTGSWNYQDRQMKRMTFTVVKGFTDVKMEVPNVEIFNRKTFKVTLTDKLSGKPICFENVLVYVFDEEKQDYAFYQEGTTDINGELSLVLPKNSEEGVVPIRVAYNGNVARFGVDNTTSYCIEPIDTHLSIAAAPVHYRDNGTLSALLYDEFGFKLANQKLEFYVLLDGVKIGDIPATAQLIEEGWLYVGQAVTNSEGYCSIEYNACFPEGFYEVRVGFAGDSTYNSTTSAGPILEVQKELLNINFLPNSLTYGRAGFVSAYLADDEGEPAIVTPVTFSAYYEHGWHDLGTTNTTSDGLATINTTVYWDEGTYVLRLTKEEDDRYATNVEYGNLTVSRTLSGLDILISSTTYCEAMTLEAILTCENGTVIDLVENQVLLFYVVTKLAGGSIDEFLYIGYGLTDSEGRATCIGTANLLPGLYMVRVFFPGNGFMKPIDAYEYGLEIRKAEAKITIRAPGTVPIFDYADFAFNLTDPHGNPAPGERMHVRIYNSSNPLDVVTEVDVISDGLGIAFFRWVPATLGFYSIEANLESDRYVAPTSTTRIEVIRKAVAFNVTMNSIRFHRGEECDLAGNVTFAYIHQNGTAEYFPAPAVPLQFFIWNESSFIHPVSGFVVPNVPLLNFAGQEITYTGSEVTDTGQFSWSFNMHDALYGLQSGRYFVKIKVDTTRTGFYEGQCYLSFDLVEYTQMNITVVPSARVLTKKEVDPGKTRLARTDYYVDENETIIIQLREQDNQTLQPWNEFGPTFRNLTINIGTENIITFGVDPDGTPYLYNTTQDFTTDGFHNPTFDPTNGTYRFNWAPFLAGPCDVGVTFSGDRFFEANHTSFKRIVSTRPVIMWSDVTYTTELYRQGVNPPYSSAQNFTEFDVRLTDLISGEIIPYQLVQFYYDNQLMTTAKGYNIDANWTNSNGHVWNRWDIPDVPKLIQAGIHKINFLSVKTRNFTAEWSPAHTIHTWETTTCSITYKSIEEGKVRVTVTLQDQDGEIVNNGLVAIQINGMIENLAQNFGGQNRIYQISTSLAGMAQIDCDFVEAGFRSGPFWISADFVGNWELGYRASSIFAQGTLNSGTSGGVVDQWNEYSKFAVSDGSSIYHSPHEIRQFLPEKSNLLVRTYDMPGYHLATGLYYVWQTPRISNNVTDMNCYYQGTAEGAGVILAFCGLDNATAHIAANQLFYARLVDYAFVWSVQSTLIQGGSVTASRSVDLQSKIQNIPLVLENYSPQTAGDYSPDQLSKGTSGWTHLFENFALTAEQLEMPYLYEFLFRTAAAACNGWQFPAYRYTRNVEWKNVTDVLGTHEIFTVTIKKEPVLLDAVSFLGYFIADKLINSYVGALNNLFTRGQADPVQFSAGLVGAESDDFKTGTTSKLAPITTDMVWGIFARYGEGGDTGLGSITKIILDLIQITIPALIISSGTSTDRLLKSIQFLVLSLIETFFKFLPTYNSGGVGISLYDLIFTHKKSWGDCVNAMVNSGLKAGFNVKIKWEMGCLLIVIGTGIFRSILYDVLKVNRKDPSVKGIEGAVSKVFSWIVELRNKEYERAARGQVYSEVMNEFQKMGIKTTKINTKSEKAASSTALSSVSFVGFVLDIGLSFLEKYFEDTLGNVLAFLIMFIVRTLVQIAIHALCWPANLPSMVASIGINLVLNIVKEEFLKLIVYPFVFSRLNSIMYRYTGYVPVAMTFGAPPAGD